jgi:integrase
MPGRRRVDLSTPTARKRLPVRRNSKPHWHPITEGRSLGYRRIEVAGSWCARYYHGSGKYAEETLGLADDVISADGEEILTFAQALKQAIAWCDSQEGSGRGHAQLRSPYTVRQALEDYLHWYRAHRKAAWDAEQKIKSCILPTLSDEEVAKLTARQIRLWHQDMGTSPGRLRGGHLRPLETPDHFRKRKNTANRVLTTLKAALNMAVAEGRVAPGAAAAWQMVKPFKGVDVPTVRFFDEDEIQRLLNASSPDFRLLVTGALLTGCRYGELAGAKVGDYLLEGQALQISGKTGSRVTFLTQEGAAFFEAQTFGRAPEDFLFRQASGRPWHRTEQARPMAAAVEAAHIPRPNNFHILRHTYASHYLMNGGDLPGLAQQLGHADTRMTSRHYAHLASKWRSADVQRSALRLGLEPGNVARIGAARRKAG